MSQNIFLFKRKAFKVAFLGWRLQVTWFANNVIDFQLCGSLISLIFWNLTSKQLFSFNNLRIMKYIFMLIAFRILFTFFFKVLLSVFFGMFLSTQTLREYSNSNRNGLCVCVSVVYLWWWTVGCRGQGWRWKSLTSLLSRTPLPLCRYICVNKYIYIPFLIQHHFNFGLQIF